MLQILNKSLSSNSLLDTLENTNTTLYFMISRSVLLYFLLVWYIFMYICCIPKSKKKIKADPLIEHPIPNAPSLLVTALHTEIVIQNHDEYEYYLPSNESSMDLSLRKA